MEIRKIDADAYAAYMKKQPRWFYNQDAAFCRWMSSEGKNLALYALMDEEKILVATKVSFARYRRFFLSAEIAFCPLPVEDGVLIFSRFLSRLLKELKKNPRVLRLRVAPLLSIASYDDLERQTPNSQAEDLRKELLKLGFTALAGDFFTDVSLQPRFLYVKNIEKMDEEELFSSLQYRVRNDMRRAAKIGIKTRFLKADELHLFNEMLDETIARTGMPVRRASRVCASMLERAGGVFFFPAAFLNGREALQGMEREFALLQEECPALETNQSKKAANRLKGLREQQEALRLRMEEVRQAVARHGEEIPLAVSQFCLSPSDLINLQSVARDEFISWSPVYAIHERMLKFALERQVKYYNFFAVERPFDSEVDRGVLDFKRRFGGALEEYAGSFEYRLRFNFLQAKYDGSEA